MIKKSIQFILYTILLLSPICAEIDIICSEKWENHQESDKKYYELCYVDDLELPEYVYWNLTKEETVDTLRRKDSFRFDKDIILGSAYPSDYTNSGYDRGHLAPVDDFKFSQEAMDSTFLMSNIAPQLPGFNRHGAWRESEIMGEVYAVNYDYVDIIAGPIVLDKSLSKYIGTKTSIVVPDGFFKIFYNKDIGLKDAYIIYQNDCSNHLDAYKVSVEDVENKTGLKFIFK